MQTKPYSKIPGPIVELDCWAWLSFTSSILRFSYYMTQCHGNWRLQTGSWNSPIAYFLFTIAIIISSKRCIKIWPPWEKSTMFWTVQPRRLLKLILHNKGKSRGEKKKKAQKSTIFEDLKVTRKFKIQVIRV